MRMQLTLVWCLAIVAACGGGDAQTPPDATPDTAIDAPPPVDAPPGFCANEDRDDDYVEGMVKVGANGYSVVLVTSEPAPDPKGNYDWNIRVLDPAMAPVDNLTIKVVPFMPDHGHGTAVQAIVTPTGNGNYAISPINLFMTGLWAVRHGLRDATDTEVDAVVYRFCVD